MVVPPATAVAVPPQVLVSPLGVATTSPAGRLSVNATPASATALAGGLVMVKVSEVVPFSGIPDAPNALTIDGGATTSILADAVPPVPPSVDVTGPATLFLVPAVVPVTLIVKVHWVLWFKLALVKLMLLLPATAVGVVLHVFPVKPLGVATTSPAR